MRWSRFVRNCLLPAVVWAAVLCVGGAGAAPAAVRAAKTDKAEKKETGQILDEDMTVITSDGGLNLDYSSHVAVFKKNVVVTDHRGTLKAQEMRIFFEAETSKIKTIEAQGNVEIIQEGRVAYSQNALIRSEEGVIVLTGDPRIKQGRDLYSADKITIYSKTNQVIFEPKAKLVIFQQPGQKKEFF